MMLLNTKYIKTLMESCCVDYDNVVALVNQDDGIMLTWHYSDIAGPVYTTIESLTSSEVGRMNAITLNKAILQLILFARVRINHHW